MPTETNAVEILTQLENDVDELVADLGRELADYFDKKFGPVISKISDLQAKRPRLQTKPVSWKDAEAQRKSYAPKWKGIRGLLRWLWKGHDTDDPQKPSKPTPTGDLAADDIERMFPRADAKNECRLTLSEYTEFNEQIDLLADEIIDTLFKEQTAHDGVKPIFDRFRDRLRDLIRNARQQIVQGSPVQGAPIPPPLSPTQDQPGVGPVSGGPRVPSEKEQDLDEPEDLSRQELKQQYAAGEEARQQAAKHEKLSSKIAIALGGALEDAAMQTRPEKPKKDWFTWIGKGARPGKNKFKEPHILAWLIKQKVDILDERAVSKKIASTLGHGFENTRGNIAENLAARLKKELDYTPDDVIEAYEALGWKPSTADRMRIKGTSVPERVDVMKPSEQPKPKPKPEKPKVEKPKPGEEILQQYSLPFGSEDDEEEKEDLPEPTPEPEVSGKPSGQFANWLQAILPPEEKEKEKIAVAEPEEKAAAEPEEEKAEPEVAPEETEER
jgi:hypothetical protein